MIRSVPIRSPSTVRPALVLLVVAMAAVSCIKPPSRQPPAEPPVASVPPPETIEPTAPPPSIEVPPTTEVPPSTEVPPPADPPVVAPPPPQPKNLNVCVLLGKMKPCWENATKLLARIQSCGQLATGYGEGVQEEIERLGAAVDRRSVEVATFGCAGICSLKRGNGRLTWPATCSIAATALRCAPSVCPVDATTNALGR